MEKNASLTLDKLEKSTCMDQATPLVNRASGMMG